MKPLIIKEFIADVKNMAELVDMMARFRNDQDKRKKNDFFIERCHESLSL
ncbi:MAG: hypothetical protein IKP54_00355 [Bacteroidales bacterium]|nr:hypothetical protein [Bacteroidales bacterium]